MLTAWLARPGGKGRFVFCCGHAGPKEVARCDPLYGRLACGRRRRRFPTLPLVHEIFDEAKKGLIKVFV